MSETEQNVARILEFLADWNTQLSDWNTQLTSFKTAITTLEENQKFILGVVKTLKSEVEELKKTPPINIPLPVKSPKSPVVAQIPKALTLEQLFEDIPVQEPVRACESLKNSLSEFEIKAKSSRTMPSICAIARDNGECSELQRVRGIECKRSCSGAMNDKKDKNYKGARELAIRCGYDSDDLPTRFKD